MAAIIAIVVVVVVKYAATAASAAAAAADDYPPVTASYSRLDACNILDTECQVQIQVHYARSPN